MALNTPQGGAPLGHKPIGRAHPSCTPKGLVGPTWVPLTYASTHPPRLVSEKIPPFIQTRVLTHLAAIFDLLAQSSICKTILPDCSSVCDSSNGPISFRSGALYIANFCCCGDLVLELACQIYMVQSSFFLHYIVSRHL